MSFEQLISDYGYPAILIGTFLEGETILVLAGFAAHRGYLELPWVLLSAFVGTLCGDQLNYYIGRCKGVALLENRPRWREKSERVRHMLNKHQILLILGFRFIYGIRSVTPFLIGISEVPPLRFLVLNMIGAALWAIAIGVAGYLFGHALELFIDDVKRYEMWAFLCIAIAGALLFLFHQRARRRAKNFQQTG
jgi:membrane protein DedA with SNARE-associated domain